MLNYTDELCHDFYHENIDECKKSHNLFEKSFHPNCFLKQPCQRTNHYSLYEEQSKRDGADQFRLEACPFYHTAQENRGNLSVQESSSDSNMK